MISPISEKLIRQAISVSGAVCSKAPDHKTNNQIDTRIFLQIRFQSIRDQIKHEDEVQVLPQHIEIEQNVNQQEDNSSLNDLKKSFEFDVNEENYNNYISEIKRTLGTKLPRPSRMKLNNQPDGFTALNKFRETLQNTYGATDANVQVTVELSYLVSAMKVRHQSSRIIATITDENQPSDKHVKTIDFSGAYILEAVENMQNDPAPEFNIKSVMQRIVDAAETDYLVEYYHDLYYEMRDSRWKMEREERARAKKAA